jgi:hypothetical protein
MSDKKQLLEEITKLIKEAQRNLEEGRACVQAAYHATCDLGRCIPKEKGKQKHILENSRDALMEWGAELYKKQEFLDVLLSGIVKGNGVNDES